MAFSGLLDASGKIAAQYLPPSGGGGGGVVALFDADVNLVPVDKPAVSIVGNISYTPSASGVAVITGTAQVSFTSAVGSGNSCVMWLYQDGAQIQDEIETTDQYSEQERSMTQQGAVNVSAGVPITLSLAFQHGGPDAGSAVVEAWSISVITPPPS
jgi:hypothetical protein